MLCYNAVACIAVAAFHWLIYFLCYIIYYWFILIGDKHMPQLFPGSHFVLWWALRGNSTEVMAADELWKCSFWVDVWAPWVIHSQPVTGMLFKFLLSLPNSKHKTIIEVVGRGVDDEVTAFHMSWFFSCLFPGNTSCRQKWDSVLRVWYQLQHWICPPQERHHPHLGKGELL